LFILLVLRTAEGTKQSVHLRCSAYAYTLPRQQEPGISPHLNTFLRAFSHFSRFAVLSQPTNREKEHEGLYKLINNCGTLQKML
jgi:hypothetical protein